jgi:superfamily I DNA and/or RNA helicase
MIQYGDWKKLLTFYMSCIEQEIAQQASFSVSGKGVKYITSFLNEERFISSDETSIIIPLSKIVENFVMKSFFRGKSNKLYYAYPFISTLQGDDYKIYPIFVHELDYQIVDNNKALLIKKQNPHFQFNYSLLHKEGLVHEYIHQINNEIYQSQQDYSNEIPKNELVKKLVKTAIKNTRFANISKVKPAELDELNLNNLGKDEFHNQAILYWGGTNWYFQGVLEELEQLKSQDKHNEINGTSLKNLFNKGIDPNVSKKLNYVFSVLPLDKYQEKAIKKGLSQNFSVISGPPGTGKSQILVNLIVNALINNQTVLFASKNNKAVDVVYDRLNTLTTDSYVVRMGNKKVRALAFEDLSRMASKIKYGGENVEKLEKWISEARNAVDSINNLEKEIENIQKIKSIIKTLKEKVPEEQKNIKLVKKLFDAKIINVEGLNQYKVEFRRINRNNLFIFEKLLDLFLKKKTKTRYFEKFINYLKTLNLSGVKCANFSEIEESLKNIEDLVELTKLQFELSQKEDLKKIQKELNDTKKYLYENTINIYSNKWAHNLSSASPDNANALSDFIEAQQIINSENPYFKKGTIALKNKSQSLISKVMEILPIWGVTNLAVKNSFPLKPSLFDYVIIDEASQCDIPSAIPLLFRAKKAIIIGDKEQLKHVSTLSENYERQIAERTGMHAEIIDYSYKNKSLYDLCEKKYLKKEKPLILKGHYRCHPDIIEFSNRNFYNEELELFTKRSDQIIKKTGMFWKNIRCQAKRASTGSAYNIEEAEESVNYLVRLINNYGDKVSYGIISPFRKQANLISEKFAHYVSKNKELINYDILIDTVHKFQGDEKDIVIFSPVVTKGIPAGTEKFVDNNSNLLNVTVTRARKLFIVFGDFSYCSKCSGLLGKLAEYINSLENVKTKL